MSDTKEAIELEAEQLVAEASTLETFRAEMVRAIDAQEAELLARAAALEARAQALRAIDAQEAELLARAAALEARAQALRAPLNAMPDDRYFAAQALVASALKAGK